jgi:thiamine-phosphate pyrophosphorylase
MGPNPFETVRALADQLGDRLAVHIREKDLSGRELCRWVDELLPITQASGSHLLVNGRLDVALAHRPDVGLQLPELGIGVAQARALLGPSAWIGRSTHDEAGVRQAVAEGADLVTLAPVFPVPGKGAPLGLQGLTSAVTASGAGPQIFALGGITIENVDAVLATGVGGIAAIRGLWSCQAPGIRDAHPEVGANLAQLVEQRFRKP